MGRHGITRGQVENMVGCYIEDLIEQSGYRQTALDSESIQAHIGLLIDHIELDTERFAQSLKSMSNAQSEEPKHD